MILEAKIQDYIRIHKDIHIHTNIVVIVSLRVALWIVVLLAPLVLFCCLF